MTAAQKRAALGLLLFGGAALLLWPHPRRLRAVTNPVTPLFAAPFRLEGLPDKGMPRFDKKDIGPTDSPALAINAANKIIGAAIVHTAKNPFIAVSNLINGRTKPLTPQAIIESADPDFTNQYTAIYDNTIMAQAQAYRVSPAVIKQLLIKESSLNPKAVGSIGEQGLAQARPETFAEIMHDIPNANPFNPEHSIIFAARYVRWLLDNTAAKAGGESYRAALQAYNGGIGNYWKGRVSSAAKVYADTVITRSAIYAADDFSDAAP